MLSRSYKLAIQNRLIGLSILVGIGVIAFLFFFYNSFSSSLEEEKKLQSKSLSQSAMGVIEHFHVQALAGVMSQAEAQQIAMEGLKAATYGDQGYFWINSGDGLLLMQPHTPELVGNSQLDMKDVKGQYIFRNFIEVAKQGGWVSYYWPKPGKVEEYPKISYVAYFAPWDWVLGTGVYLDDMRKNVWQTVLKASGLLIVGFLVFMLMVMLVVNYLLYQLSNLAIRDELTDLYTKRFLNEIVPSLVKKQQRLSGSYLAVIFMDIDYFKRVNDSYGHAWGDAVLRRLAGVMQNNTRPDDYCIRYGGEEFVLVGIYENLSSVMQVAERVRSETAKVIFRDEKVEFQVSMSAGVAIYDGQEIFAETLKRADAKLYEAKSLGRDRVVI